MKTKITHLLSSMFLLYMCFSCENAEVAPTAENAESAPTVSSPYEQNALLTTICDISGDIIACPGDVNKTYTYTSNFTPNNVTWSVLMGAGITIGTGQGTSTVKISFGPAFTGGVIKALGKNGTVECSETFSISKGSSCPPACTDPNDCGENFDGSHTTPNDFHIYTETLDLSCVPSGSTISINCQALEVPNKFYVVGTSANSGWIGYASYSGPWGSSVNGPSSKTISFTKGTADTYTLRVETLTASTTDAWEASIICDY